MKRKAFTLIELLVVIAIIAILAAILFPVFARAKTAGKKAAGLTQGKQLGTAIMIYLADYDDTYPAATNITAGIHPIPGQVFPQLRTIVQPYVKNNDIWWVPGAPRPGEFETAGVEANLANAVAANGGIGPADDPAFLGAGSHWAYKTRATTGCPTGTPDNCRGNIAAQPSTIIENVSGVWMLWDADSNYSRFTDGNRAPFLAAPACRWQSDGNAKRQLAIFADGHAKMTAIPRPQHFENMALDGNVYVPFNGCP